VNVFELIDDVIPITKKNSKGSKIKNPVITGFLTKYLRAWANIRLR